jgi:hypothetical protein
LYQVWLKLACWFWRRRFFKIFSVFLLFCYYLPLEKGNPLHFNNLESPPPKDDLCQVWLKLAQWFWWRSRKCKSLRTDGRTDGQKAIRIAHLSFQLRWAKNQSLMTILHRSCVWPMFYTRYLSNHNADIPKRIRTYEAGQIPRSETQDKISKSNKKLFYCEKWVVIDLNYTIQGSYIYINYESVNGESPSLTLYTFQDESPTYRPRIKLLKLTLYIYRSISPVRIQVKSHSLVCRKLHWGNWMGPSDETGKTHAPWRTAPISRLLRHTRGCGESFLTWILTDLRAR